MKKLTVPVANDANDSVYKDTNRRTLQQTKHFQKLLCIVAPKRYHEPKLKCHAARSYI
jgi:hypothetical protein